MRTIVPMNELDIGIRTVAVILDKVTYGRR